MVTKLETSETSETVKFEVGDLVHHRTYCPLTSEPVVWKKVLRIREVYFDHYTGHPVYVAGGRFPRDFDGFELVKAE